MTKSFKQIYHAEKIPREHVLNPQQANFEQGLMCASVGLISGMVFSYSTIHNIYTNNRYSILVPAALFSHLHCVALISSLYYSALRVTIGRAPLYYISY